MDEGDLGFQLLTEEEIAAVICFYLFSSVLPILIHFPFISFYKIFFFGREHYVESRKVAGSNSDEVIAFFN
jgi:hypothetical protein